MSVRCLLPAEKENGSTKEKQKRTSITHGHVADSVSFSRKNVADSGGSGVLNWASMPFEGPHALQKEACHMDL
jgi:hypothetical protein